MIFKDTSEEVKLALGTVVVVLPSGEIDTDKCADGTRASPLCVPSDGPPAGPF